MTVDKQAAGVDRRSFLRVGGVAAGATALQVLAASNWFDPGNPLGGAQSSVRVAALSVSFVSSSSQISGWLRFGTRSSQSRFGPIWKMQPSSSSSISGNPRVSR